MNIMKRKRSISPNNDSRKIQKNNESNLSIEKLRESSRQQYINKTTHKQAEILSRQIKKEEALIPENNLSNYELKKRALNKRINDKDNIRNLKDQNQFISQNEGFNLKEDKFISKDKKLEQLEQTKYRSSNDHIEPISNLWEKEQEKKSGIHSKILKEKPYIFDEIKFIQSKTRERKQKEEEMQLKDEKKKTIKEIRESLPAFQFRDKIIETIQKNKITIIVGETGSGKTTQIPQYLYEAGICNSPNKMLAITQPRRVAAMSVAKRVSEEMNVELGMEVGYSIRFEDLTSDKTVIKFLTDGMMLKELMIHPDMRNYSAIMIDEAHERSLNTDILFALVKDISKLRNDFKVIIASATLEAIKMKDYFGAEILRIPGRTFPVETYYTATPESDYIEASIIATLQIHLSQPQGDILVFLTGQDEIENVAQELVRRTNLMQNQKFKLIVRPIYSTMPAEEQNKIFEPTPEGSRKVVIATNIAETSITIDGIVYVVDSGLCKQNSFDPIKRMESLVITPISKANADQRKGRAGRVRPGKCFRLYTLNSYKEDLPETPIPEIQRSNLASVCLQLKSMGIHNLLNFEWMDSPPKETIKASIMLLYAIGALGDNGNLTSIGNKMAELPLDPTLSRTLLASESYKCTDDVAIICAMLSTSQSLFYSIKGQEEECENRRKSFFQNGGDFFTLLHVYNEWKESGYSNDWCKQNYIETRAIKTAKNVYTQLTKLLHNLDIELITFEGSQDEQIEKISKSFCTGFLYNIANYQRDGSYKTYQNLNTVYIHPTSSLIDKKAKWVLFHELLFTSKEYMREVIEIKPDWLLEIAPHVVTSKLLKGFNK